MNYKKFVLLTEKTPEIDFQKYFLPLNIIQFLKLMLTGSYEFDKNIKLYSSEQHLEKHPSLSDDCQTVFIYFSENPWSVSEKQEELPEEELPEDQPPGPEEEIIVTESKIIKLDEINKDKEISSIAIIEINEPMFPSVQEVINGDEIGKEAIIKLFKAQGIQIPKSYDDSDLKLEEYIKTIINDKIKNTSIVFTNNN